MSLCNLKVVRAPKWRNSRQLRGCTCTHCTPWLRLCNAIGSNRFETLFMLLLTLLDNSRSHFSVALI